MKSWLKNIYQKLPLIRELVQIQKSLQDLHTVANATNHVQVDNYFTEELIRNPRYRDARKLNHREFQVFSQNGEDGIIAEIFSRIGVQNRYFVEFGVGDGLENNTTFLLNQGWRGCWIEGDSASVRKIQNHFSRVIATGDLRVQQAFITAENINQLLTRLDVPETFDLLSVDIDRNTFHVWQAIERFKPRVIVVEYNATFPPEIDWAIDYASDRVWNYTCHFGASLKAFEKMGAARGYSLVGCDFSGTNAFFVKNTEPITKFAEPFTAENHYEPPRYWSIRRGAHRRAFTD